MQSPTISIPKKKTDEVDWTTPIRTVISRTYGESPDTYATECAALQRCRQDAVRGAGSETTARDLLYRYFGQLELLELRFAEIRVNFPWNDAFTSKATTQTSVAFEKASIIFQIAATHSAIAFAQNRFEPEGLKTAYKYFCSSAGMLTYINDNFLHAPSTDLSREVVKYLSGIMIAQATEVFFETMISQKKSNGLISKVTAQAASLYAGLQEEVKEFAGRGIFDRNWVTLIQIKAKYFASLSQYYRSLVDTAAGKHGEALARLMVAEREGTEAHRMATNFNFYFLSTASPQLPPDAGPAIVEITKAHSTLAAEKKAEVKRDNELIYNDLVPSEPTLTPIEKLAAAKIIPIQEVYSQPDVQKVIGPDLFIKLVPLSVHESASVYSEEKAKLVRGEVQKSDAADSEFQAGLDSLGLPGGLNKWRDVVAGNEGSRIPREMEDAADEVRRAGGIQLVEKMFADLERVKSNVAGILESVSRDLEIESRDCEAMRIKYEHLWTQEPSGSLTRSLRQDLKSHQDSLSAASGSDTQAVAIWNQVKPVLSILLSGDEGLERFFAAQESNTKGQENLLDVTDDMTNQDAGIIEDISNKVNEIDEKLGRLNKIKRERGEVLKDLKEKIQSDDVSHLLLLNRRSPSVEPSLFAQELEKFRPFQNRISATVHHQEATLDEVGKIWRALQSGRGREWVKRIENAEKRRAEAIGRLSEAKDGWNEVRDGLGRGIQFYTNLADLSSSLKRSVDTFVSSRRTEREKLASEADTKQRLSVSTPSSSTTETSARPPLPPPPSQVSSLTSSMASLSMSSAPSPPPHSSTPWMQGPPPVPPPPPRPSYPPATGGYPQTQSSQPPPGGYGAPPPLHQQQQPGYSNPPPQQQQHQSRYSSPPPPQQQQQHLGYAGPPPQQHGYASPPPQQQQSYGQFNAQQQQHIPPSVSNFQSPPPADPYANLFGTPGLSSQFSTSISTPQAPPPAPQYPSQQPQQQYYSSPPPPSQPQRQPSYPPPPSNPQQYQPYSSPQQPQQQQATNTFAFPPPPQPISYQSQQFSTPPPAPPSQQQQQYQYTPQQPYGGYNR